MGNSSARAAVEVGSVIADTYTIEALIGRGGMGAVFLAGHNRLPGKKVAIKLLHVELTTEEVIARFRREAMIASQLDHPNIVRVDDYNVAADGTPYLVLEYLAGESLAQRLLGGPMPLAQVLTLIRQVGSAMAAAHRAGIVHRDLKPQNIFLVPTELDGRVVDVAKVLDFGISKILGSQTVKTLESSLLGTPQYMAPEQATGQHTTIDERTDIFALGAIVYEMLCGQPAFSGQSIPEVVFKVVYEQPPPLAPQVPTVPEPVVRAVMQAMAKPANERFPTVSAFVEALTGQPLAPPRSMQLASAGGGPSTGSPARSTGKEAFAHTVDSGEHASSVVPAAAHPHAPTVASMPGAAQTETGHPDAVVAASQPRSLPGPSRPGDAPVAAPPAPRRRSALLVGSAIVAVALAGLVGFLAVRGGGADEDVAALGGTADGALDAAQVAIVADAAQVEIVADAAQVAIALDAGPAPRVADAAVTAAVPADAARPRPPRQPAEQRRSPPPDDDAAGDAAVAATVRKAEAAYRAGQRQTAYRLANEVINTRLATRRQLSRAHAVRGAIECIDRNNLQAAAADLRNIVGRDHRRTLISACVEAGVMRRGTR